ncbi:MAG: PAS domain-containing protein [Planctomycetes bacterium]|nr:PAS domain-containing protein [Planctomycetota bacterium]
MTVLRSAGFWRTYAVAAILAIFGGCVCVFVVGPQVEQAVIERIDAQLTGHARLLSDWGRSLLSEPRALADVQPAPPQAHAEGVRATLIRADGTVVAETSRETDGIPNHGDRPEVQEAMRSGSGRARRHSETTGVDLYYVALRLDDGKQSVGVVRCSAPLDSVHAARRELLAAAAAAIACALLLAVPLVALLERVRGAEFVELQRVIDEQRAGRLDARVRALSGGETRALGNAINRLGEELARRIAELSIEGARLRAMLAGMIEGVVALDESERVAFSNRAARNLLESEGVALDGRRLWEAVRTPELAELLEEARATDATCARQLSLATARGELVLQVHASRFSTPAAGTGLVLVFHDITELRKLERIRRDFVANVGHELKTPLTAISGYVDTLLDGALEERADLERFLGRIQANAQRLSHLVSDLLSLARIESGKSIAAIETVEVRSALEQAIRRHEPAARARGLELILAHDSADSSVLADVEALQQILDNLIDNAIKYTQRGRVLVRARVRGEHGCLEVEDTGIGIPEQDRERVFERFFTVDRARSRELGGTGLGLSIVRHLVAAMRGRPRAETDLPSDACQGSL